jgi:hypothetical protein
MATSVGMNKIAAELGSEFVVALGDNFYESGISTDENSERFQETWENVYTGKFLQTPWYIVAGNHGKNSLFYSFYSKIVTSFNRRINIHTYNILFLKPRSQRQCNSSN